MSDDTSRRADDRTNASAADGGIREISVELQTSCLDLRHKLMYVDERQMSPGRVDDSSDTRCFFCLQTHDALGPDGEPVSPDDCTAQRRCYSAP